MDISAFKDVFAAEARDYLQALNNDLLDFEKDPANKAILDEMFRAAHSLKGMAGTMGFDELAEFTHEMESVLDLLRLNELRVDTHVINVLFQAVDTLEVLLEQTISDEPIGSFSNELAALRALISRRSAIEEESATEPEVVSVDLDEFSRETVKQGIEQGFNAYEIIVSLRPKTLLKSVRVYTVFQALEAVGTIIQTNPSIQDLEEEQFDLEFGIIILTKESPSEIRSIIEGISEIDGVSVAPVRLGNGEEIIGIAEEPEPVAESDEAAAAVETKTVPSRHHRSEALVRVETERLDKLINLVGELVISRTQVMEIADVGENSEQKNVLLQLDRVTTELQYAAMSLRMVPLKQVFDRFPRMVRDFAQSSGKRINLEIFGEMTELDRSIVNQIADPLVHLIRNSIDHGLEPEEERIAKGKPAAGTIRLGARHEGSHILIEISDDGMGLDVERIRSKAIETGLLADGTEELSMAEAVEFLFSPGFSTAQEVTDLSGRGVGLDAVLSTVESLSGTIEMQSEPGQSLTTTIKLPLTLAIIKALLVVADGEILAVPLQAVRENIQVMRSETKTIQQHNVIMLRNEVLPLFDLAECLGFTPYVGSDLLQVIILDIRGEKVGFIVEDLIGQQEIVIKSLSGVVKDIPGITGATVLGNGNVALILDNSTLLDRR
ncbi:MAG: chemotaxis protein CheA [Firmicutes bacterium]|jgi:two-component system chemotaxis sensor kinase CheA|nr:chemotaxis protein CheA [Bacillota bacterium]